MQANDIQVGGEHYQHATGICPHCRKTVQHWDLYGPQPYLEGAATKYITRWRGKHGLASLEKAVHFVQKIIEQNFPDYELRFSVQKREAEPVQANQRKRR